MVERGYSVAGFEFVDSFAYCHHGASDVVAGVVGFSSPQGEFPVLWVGACNYDFDEDFIGAWSGYGDGGEGRGHVGCNEGGDH